MSPRAVVDEVAQTLGRIIMEAVAYIEGMKAQGATRAQTDQALENVIRDAWPKAKDRTVPWRYICETCGDTGLQMLQCTPRFRCNGVSTRIDSPGDKPGKYKRLCVNSTTYEHDYGIPCTCAKGDTFRPRQQNQEDAFERAAKSKPRPMSRFGR